MGKHWTTRCGFGGIACGWYIPFTCGQSKHWLLGNRNVALASGRLVQASSQTVIDELVTDIFQKMAAGKVGLQQIRKNSPMIQTIYFKQFSNSAATRTICLKPPSNWEPWPCLNARRAAWQGNDHFHCWTCCQSLPVRPCLGSESRLCMGTGTESGWESDGIWNSSESAYLFWRWLK